MDATGQKPESAENRRSASGRLDKLTLLSRLHSTTSFEAVGLQASVRSDL